MTSLSDPEIWISLVTLTVLEIVLGIDNIVFISILSGKLPVSQQKKARQTGISLAMITRILLLLSISWVMKLTGVLFNPAEWLGIENQTVLNKLAISGRDLILIAGGLFLIYKSAAEIHEKMEGDHQERAKSKAQSFANVIVQILLLDIVFSLDSVITAVGMANNVLVMIAAVVLAVGVMLFASDGISSFVNKHPTIKMLALSFLLLIGVSLLAEGFDNEIPKGYIYFAMAFSVLVEMLNLGAKWKKAKAIDNSTI
jgi:predicted tellurium resistance membrane protein TerC